MDPRIERHAEILVEHSASVSDSDMVEIVAPACANDLVVALGKKLGEVGGNPRLTWLNRQAHRAYLRAVDPDSCMVPQHDLAAAKNTDVKIVVRGNENVAEQSDSPNEARQAVARATGPVIEAEPDRTIITQYPAPGEAQRAGMSTEAYEDLVWSAVNRDWDDQRVFQEQLVERLDSTSEVRIRSGEETDLEMSVEGMNAVNSYGKGNLPDGEVFTAPVADSVDGTVRFDFPVSYGGREIENVWLSLESGEVVDWDATANEKTLEGILETDDGSRYLGELGFGMNRGIDRFTHNVLFDEKMTDTIHLALGRAIDESVGRERAGNDSAVHVDMLADVSTDSAVEFDGEVVQRNGTFAFEDGFER